LADQGAKVSIEGRSTQGCCSRNFPSRYAGTSESRWWITHISNSSFLISPMSSTPPSASVSPESSDHVPWKSKLAWALGSLGDNYAAQTITQLATPVYNVALGVPAAMLAKAIALPRLLDMFADPTVGYLSDNAHTRWGRRRPFILAGAIPLAILMVILWMPGQQWSSPKLATYFAIATFLYYLAYALFIVPYRALGFELTTNYNERTRVQGWGMIFGLVGGLGIPWLYKMVLIFSGAAPGMENPPAELVLRGVFWTSVAVAVVILIACAAPAILCRERVQTVPQPHITITAAVMETLRNWPFFNMLFARTLVLVSTFAVTAISTPLMIYFLFDGDQEQASTLLGVSGNLLFAGAAIGIPFNAWMSSAIGKRLAFVVCLAVAAIGSTSQFWTYRAEHPFWILPSNFVLGFGLQGVWLMCQSMVADVCDEDELRTGRRREGIYGASYALMEKLGINVGFLVGGLVAGWCGYVTGQPSAEILHRMWMAAVFIPGFGMLLGGVLIWSYPLSRERMAAIRAELDRRVQSEVGPV